MTIKSATLLLLLLWQAAAREEPPRARPGHMRYERAIRVPAGEGQACAVLDGMMYPHAAPSLKDLRVFPGPNGAAQGTPAREVPYAVTLSETETQETQPARVLNLGTSRGGTGSRIAFDLEMPDRAYTDVALDLGGHDFLATAEVTGSDAPGAASAKTALGTFTLFDLSAQHLSRDTTLPLAESTFRYLHVLLSVSPAPGRSPAGESSFVPAMVEGAEVPPSREAQTLYTTVASTSTPSTGVLAAPRKTRFDIPLPLRVPVERVSFDLSPAYTGNFSRDVTINASPDPDLASTPASSLPRESLFGTISRVHSTQAGHKIDRQQLSLPATLGSNLQHPGHVSIEVENGDDQPLPIAAVRLEMRQRKLCFDAPASVGSGLVLYYGDPTLLAPVYDYDRLFVPADKTLVADLGPEMLNPSFDPPPPDIRPFTERHPEVLWIALIAVVCALGAVALKSSRNVGA